MTTPGIELPKGFVLKLDELVNGDIECHLEWRNNEKLCGKPRPQIYFTIPKDRRAYIANALVDVRGEGTASL